MNWYVLKTKPKREDAVMNLLQRASFEVFLPKLKAVSYFKPLFPSYLFIHTNLQDQWNHRLIRFTRGVSRILGDADGPLPITDIIVETLKERTRDGSLIEQELLFKEGDEVEVKKGLLRDLRGIIEENLPESGRVKVLFRWLSGKFQAILRYKELEKAA